MEDRDVAPQQFRPRMPGHLVDDAKGLGDVIKRVIGSVGIKPCGGCEQRAEALNALFPFGRAK